jgi:hypothetical protein
LWSDYRASVAVRFVRVSWLFFDAVELGGTDGDVA